MGIITFCMSLGLGLVFVSSPGLVNDLWAQASPGKLNKVHEQFQGTDNCSKCHIAPGKTAPGKCLACHTDLAKRIKAEKGFHRDKPESCADCHGEHAGRDSQLSPLDTNDFDHNDTGFSLEGVHARVEKCQTCHNSKNSLPRKYSKSYLLKEDGCRGCHQDPHRGEQPVCVDCHHTRDWSVDIW